jgi:RHS repeat-associated protein
VYHAAGLAGAGGSSYIDSVILRDRDANTAWEDQADGTLEERVYLCQNWRADVVALMTSGGHLINQVRYDGLTPAAARRGGVPFGIATTDLDGDGDVDGDDATLFATYHGAGTMPFADWNFDGTVDLSDQSAYTSDKNADTGLGRGDPGYAWSETGGANRKAYAGYEIDPVLTGSEGWESVYHVRHRVYLSRLGRWTRRDPLGYVDGMSLYRCASRVLVAADPNGFGPCPPDGDCGSPAPPGGGPTPPIDDTPVVPPLMECLLKVDDCLQNDPATQALYDEAKRACAGAGGGPTWTCVRGRSCGGGGTAEYCCQRREMVFCSERFNKLSDPCSAVREELVHAMDFCRVVPCQDTPDSCGAPGDDHRENACYWRIFTEMHSIVRSGACCEHIDCNRIDDEYFPGGVAYYDCISQLLQGLFPPHHPCRNDFNRVSRGTNSLLRQMIRSVSGTVCGCVPQ